MQNKIAGLPGGRAFLELMQKLADETSRRTDFFCMDAGASLPRTIAGTGDLLSVLYRLASCYDGCQGGDHQIERLVGKIVSQGMAAYRLIRAAQYDEALTLICIMGEIVNLLWLFQADESELKAWKTADNKKRLRDFGPSAVQGRLEAASELGAPIDDDRYAAFNEIAVLPMPGLGPRHSNEPDKPAPAATIQNVGVFVSVNELAYASAMAAIPIGVVLDCAEDMQERLKETSMNLVKSLGSYNVLKYEAGLREATRGKDQAAR